jgi:hypothetical protein
MRPLHSAGNLVRTTERHIRMATRRRALGPLVAACLALMTVACGHATPEPSSAGTGGDTEHRAAMKTQRFDALAISVVLQSSSVASGKTIHSRLIVENPSDTTVIDPDCSIATGRYALVPVNDPDAELWVQPVADCGDPFEMKPGFREVFSGPVFVAHTKYGDPLPPCEYLAALEIQGLSQRLEYPVTVE